MNLFYVFYLVGRRGVGVPGDRGLEGDFERLGPTQERFPKVSRSPSESTDVGERLIPGPCSCMGAPERAPWWEPGGA
jgi:hypothetical protein